MEQTTLATSLGEETAETKMVSLERSQAELQAAVEAFWSWENLRKIIGTSTINAGLVDDWYNSTPSGFRRHKS